MVMNNKYGTHNSLTYHRPQWYLRPFNFIAQCQSLTIEQQYGLGVRYFDFRIRFVGDKIYAGHGMMTYKVDLVRLFRLLNIRCDCVVNIVLENHFWEHDKYDERFKKYVDGLTKSYRHIQFVGGDKKRPWTNLVSLPSVPAKACFEFYEGNNFKFPYPKYYAKKNNQKYRDAVNDTNYSLFDFIEL